jgi:hypothetical protein
MSAPIPEHVVAYAAGLRGSGGEWTGIAEVLATIGMGTWSAKELEDACLDWIYEHVNIPGVFTRALRGSA